MMYRQGDVLIRLMDKNRNSSSFRMGFDQKEAKKLDHTVLAWGEVTGHKHEVIGECELFEMRDGQMYLKVATPSKVVHEEHGTIELPVGEYEVIRQREFDGTRSFNVLD